MHNIPFADLKKSTYNEKDQQMIEGWQDRAIVLAEQDNFRLHPVTKKLAAEAQEQIEIIDNRLKTEEDMPEAERKSLFKLKKAHEFYLNLFTWDPTQELKQIENMVTDEIQNNNN